MLCTYCKIVHFTNCIVHFVSFYSICTKCKIKVCFTVCKEKKRNCTFYKKFIVQIANIIIIVLQCFIFH